jgi:hypothetical protein
MSFKFTSNHNPFLRKHAALKDMIMGNMAMDIEAAIKTTAGTPVKHGIMKSQVRHFKNTNMQWRVEANAEYSGYQELGQRRDGSHRVRHYTTPGTSAGWFMRAINSVLKHRKSYIDEAKVAVGM